MGKKSRSTLSDGGDVLALNSNISASTSLLLLLSFYIDLQASHPSARHLYKYPPSVMSSLPTCFPPSLPRTPPPPSHHPPTNTPPYSGCRCSNPKSPHRSSWFGRFPTPATPPPPGAPPSVPSSSSSSSSKKRSVAAGTSSSSSLKASAIHSASMTSKNPRYRETAAKELSDMLSGACLWCVVVVRCIWGVNVGMGGEGGMMIEDREKEKLSLASEGPLPFLDVFTSPTQAPRFKDAQGSSLQAQIVPSLSVSCHSLFLGSQASRKTSPPPPSSTTPCTPPHGRHLHIQTQER